MTKSNKKKTEKVKYGKSENRAENTRSENMKRDNMKKKKEKNEKKRKLHWRQFTTTKQKVTLSNATHNNSPVAHNFNFFCKGEAISRMQNVTSKGRKWKQHVVSGQLERRRITHYTASGSNRDGGSLLFTGDFRPLCTRSHNRSTTLSGTGRGAKDHVFSDMYISVSGAVSIGERFKHGQSPRRPAQALEHAHTSSVTIVSSEESAAR